MSRIGKLPVDIPSGVTVKIDGSVLSAKGPKGELNIKIPSILSAKIKDNRVEIERNKNHKMAMALHGTYRSHVSNAIKGVNLGWKKDLEIVGSGYKVELSGKDLVLTVGFSHPVKVEAPDGIVFAVEKTSISVEGIDKHLVGQVAANIRKVRPPEPYKGKGIKYKDEVIRRKAGKATKTAGVGGA